MIYLKISILLISSVLYAQTSYTKRSPKQLPFTRRVNSKPDDDSNCICYPKGHLPSIHNILDPNNSGQERIVVYFYKNTGSNEIKMYTPSCDKQLLIPDLPYDSGDELISVTTETINTLFYSNSNRIKIYDNHFEKLKPGETVYWPIGLNQGAVEHVYPQVKDNYPPKDRYNFNWAPNGYTVYDPIENTGAINPELNPHGGSPNSGIKPNKNSQFPSFEIDPNNNQNQLTFSFVPHDGSSFSQSGGDKNSQSLKQFVMFDEWFRQQLKNFQQYKLPHEMVSIESYALRVLVEQVLYKNNIRVGADGILRYSNGKALELGDLELRPLFIGQKLDYKLTQRIPPDNVYLPKHLPYVEGILVTLVFPPQVLGVIPLGTTYLSKQYQIHTKVGGVNSSSVSFPNQYFDTKYVPHSANYRQQFDGQVFQSSITKPGEPSSSSYYNTEKTFYSYPYSELNNDVNWVYMNQYSSGSVPESLKPPSVSQPPYFITNYREPPQNAGFPPLGSQRRKFSDVKIKHHIEPPKLKNKKQLLKEDSELKKLEKEKEDSNVESLIEPLINMNASESGRRFNLPSIKGVVKSLLDLLTESRSSEDDKLSSNSTEDVDIINESEDIKDGERPDYRIIGGNAATGSGTPLSNKGRSANIETNS